MSYSTRELRAADLGPAARFLGSVFGEAPADADVRYRWKYGPGPAGDPVVRAAFDGDQVVALVAATPRRLHAEGTVHRAAELGDLATDPAHRGRGLFRRLVEEVCEALRARNVELVYCRPNDNSFPGLVRRGGFSELFAPVSFFRPLRAGALAARRMPSGGLRQVLTRFGDGLGAPLLRPRRGTTDAALRVQELPAPGDEVDALQAEVAAAYGVMGVRDADYLRWRYLQNPRPFVLLGVYRGDALAGVACHLIQTSPTGSTLGYVVDLLARPDDEAARAALLDACVNALAERGAAAITVWTHPDGTDPLAALLARSRFWRQRQKLHFVARDLCASGVSLMTRPWFLQLGDLDAL